MTGSILIIGGSSSIGMAIAQQYSAEGKQVAIISRKPKPATGSWHWYQDLQQSEQSTKQVVQQALAHQPESIFICNGVLHDETALPEKTIQHLDTAVLNKRLHSNVIIPAMYLQALFRYLTLTAHIKLIVLSAKVGSITDNALGGWYSYRMSKAALNMLVKNMSIEVARLNKTACIVSLHPGTTDSALSQPFQRNLAVGQLQTPQQTAERLLKVNKQLQPGLSGALLNWDGTILPF